MKDPKLKEEIDHMMNNPGLQERIQGIYGRILEKTNAAANVKPEPNKTKIISMFVGLPFVASLSFEFLPFWLYLPVIAICAIMWIKAIVDFDDLL